MPQGKLFYEGIYDAIESGISASGRTRKELASIIYPGRQIETAQSILTRALSPENTDVHFSIEALLTILRETRADDFIYFLCDEFSFERPQRKDKETFKREMKQDMKSLTELVKQLTKKVDSLENTK